MRGLISTKVPKMTALDPLGLEFGPCQKPHPRDAIEFDPFFKKKGQICPRKAECAPEIFKLENFTDFEKSISKIENSASRADFWPKSNLAWAPSFRKPSQNTRLKPNPCLKWTFSFLKNHFRGFQKWSFLISQRRSLLDLGLDLGRFKPHFDLKWAKNRTCSGVKIALLEPGDIPQAPSFGHFKRHPGGLHTFSRIRSDFCPAVAVLAQSD